MTTPTHRRSTSASALVREALARYLHLHLVPTEARPVPFAAVGRNGRATIARDMEDLLAREWDEPTGDR